MLAVVQTGGKQYTVTNGDIIKVEKLEGKVGDRITLKNVLAIIDGKKTELNAKALEKAAVSAEVLEQAKEDKVIIFKKKRRQNYRRTRGHRQQLTTLRIGDIAQDGKVSTAKSTTKKATNASEKPAAKKAATETKAKAAPAKKTEAKKAETAEKKPAAKKAPAKKPAANKAKKDDKK